MIVSIVIDHLGKEYQDDDIGVAYLYCNYKRRDEQKAVNLLAAILKQLVQKRPPLSDHIVALHELHAKQGTRPSFDDLSKSLRSVLGNYSQVFMIVDALDECTDVDDTRNTLLSEIRNLQTQIDLRLMSTSRPIKNITQAFEGDLHLEIRANNEDVERYLEGQISRRPSCILRKPHLQQLVKRNIVEAVDGM